MLYSVNFPLSNVKKATSILAILFKNYHRGAEIWWLFFAQLFKNSTDCFVLEILIVVDLKIESVLLKARRKKIKFYNSLKMGATTVRQLALGNSKSEEGRGDYLDNTQISSRQWEFEFLNVIFYIGFTTQTVSQWDSLISGISSTRICMTSILWVFKLSRVDWVYEFRIFFSSNLSNILQKYLKNWFFLSFSSSEVK